MPLMLGSVVQELFKISPMKIQFYGVYKFLWHNFPFMGFVLFFYFEVGRGCPGILGFLLFLAGFVMDFQKKVQWVIF
jgi:hypothetical protein